MTENRKTLPGEKGNGTVTAKPFCVALSLPVQPSLELQGRHLWVPLTLNGKHLEVQTEPAPNTHRHLFAILYV